jgi:hypothetical protein
MNDPYDACERLELTLYEALAQRWAILGALRQRLGHDLNLTPDLAVGSDLEELHEALLRRTKRCIEIARQMELAEDKAQESGAGQVPTNAGPS